MQSCQARQFTTSASGRILSQVKSYYLVGRNEGISHYVANTQPYYITSYREGRSAPGQDCIRYTVLKQCPEIVFENLEQIYNICLQAGYFPEPWKQAMGTMIPKPNKNHKITTNYRLISLLNCIGKLFEKKCK